MTVDASFRHRLEAAVARAVTTKGVTRGAIAKSAGMPHRQVLTNLLSGHRGSKRATKYTSPLAQALGVSVAWLLSGDDAPDWFLNGKSSGDQPWRDTTWTLTSTFPAPSRGSEDPLTRCLNALLLPGVTVRVDNGTEYGHFFAERSMDGTIRVWYE